MVTMSFYGGDYHGHNKWSNSYDVFGEKAILKAVIRGLAPMV